MISPNYKALISTFLSFDSDPKTPTFAFKKRKNISFVKSPKKQTKLSLEFQIIKNANETMTALAKENEAVDAIF